MLAFLQPHCVANLKCPNRDQQHSIYFCRFRKEYLLPANDVTYR